MKLETMISDVLPEGSILYKHNHGMFDFYLDDKTFKDGINFSTQSCNENFYDFIKRTIELLIDDEKGGEFIAVTIDFAIHVGREAENL